jgi:hypothetical protein
MGIETLNSAARAAGFAMAASDDAFEDIGCGRRAPDAQWRPGEAVMVREAPPARVEWLRLVFGLLGRRVPA